MLRLQFEKVADSEYDIVLKAADADNGTKINGPMTADLTFSLTQGTTGLVNYEITPAANMSLLVNGNRYTFSFDGTNGHISATGRRDCNRQGLNSTDIAHVQTLRLIRVQMPLNKLHTAEAVDSIVDEYFSQAAMAQTQVHLMQRHQYTAFNLTAGNSKPYR